MSEEEKKQEEEVFNQKLELNELEASGGHYDYVYGKTDADEDNCVQYWHRPIYGLDGNSFPNCAATVEADSNCYRNDGCHNTTVVYDGKRTECGRTWQ